MNCPSCQYDEFQHIGTDYESYAEVEAYDKRMNKLRDIKDEAKCILCMLNLKPEHTLIEIGTGTGEFAIAAADCCSKIIAIDVSESMLKYAEKKARSRSVKNIQFVKAGFLTFQPPNESFDAIVSQFALHHLPDFWKQIALLRIYQMLKPAGKVYLKDIVYSFDPKKKDNFFERYITKLMATENDDLQYFVRHVNTEYSTLAWIMEGIINKAGLNIEWAEYKDEFIAAYLCSKSSI